MEAIAIRDVVLHAIARLKAAGVEEARQDAWLLLGHVRGQDRATLLAQAREALEPEDRRAFHRLIERRAAREPLAQIIGRREFWSLDFRITKDVLCPRPDSECLIEAALAQIDRQGGGSGWNGRILDLGTGSGCLLLALLGELKAAAGLGVDISMPALAIARSNAERLGLGARAVWLCADWGESLDGRFDLIVSNPPYVRAGEAATLAPEVERYEPAPALFAGDDGLDAYRSLAGSLRRLLAPKGVVCLELGLGQADAVERLLTRGGLEPIGRRRDLAGIDRCLLARRR